MLKKCCILKVFESLNDLENIKSTECIEGSTVENVEVIQDVENDENIEMGGFQNDVNVEAVE